MRRAAWGPAHHVLYLKLPSVTLAVLMNKMSFAVSCVVVWIQQVSEEPRAWGFSLSLLVVICEPPRPNLRVSFRVFCLSFGFCFCFPVSLYLGTVSPFRAKSVFVTLKNLFYFLTDVQWRKEIGEGKKKKRFLQSNKI